MMDFDRFSAGGADTKTPIWLLLIRILLLVCACLPIIVMVYPFILAIMFRPTTALNFLGWSATGVFILLATFRLGLGRRFAVLILAGLSVMVGLEGKLIFDRAHFAFHKSTLERAVPKVLAGETESCPVLMCFMLSRNPQVIFFERGGFVGGEWGICYDPAGLTTSTDRFHVRAYYKLEDEWYLCSS